ARARQADLLPAHRHARLHADQHRRDLEDGPRRGVRARRRLAAIGAGAGRAHPPARRRAAAGREGGMSEPIPPSATTSFVTLAPEERRVREYHVVEESNLVSALDLAYIVVGLV